MSSIVFTFGRFQPPTVGHERLIGTIIETAKTIGADHMVFLSQTTKNALNPLDWNFKRRVCEAAFRGVNISKDLSIKNPFMALEYLSESYDRIVMVAGSDQLDDYRKFQKYTDAWGTTFEVVSAGERINESEGVDGVSGSKMRQWAIEGNKDKFLASLPSSLNESIRNLVYTNTRKALKSR